MENKLKCDGDCLNNKDRIHSGEVLPVIVSGQGITPMRFNYCENAIKEDIERGFKVELVSDINNRKWKRYYNNQIAIVKLAKKQNK